VLARLADVLIVDTPAGVHGVTAAVLAASSHVLAVLQTDPLTLRSFPLLRRALDDLASQGRAPKLSGVVLNRVPGGGAVPLAALREISAAHSLDLLIEPGISEDEAFVQAAVEGIPVALYAGADRDYARLFDTLATQVARRVGLEPVSWSSKLSLVL
jgi:cellulose biosynthesis protein BcsQ